MKKRIESIEFPANPFVALADFVIVVLLIMILAFVHQSIASNRLFERLAVELHQKELIKICRDRGACDEYSKRRGAPVTGKFEQTYIDGDLQRFGFNGDLFGNAGSTRIVPGDQQTVLALGRVLAENQGNTDDPGSGLYKRIVIEGHADHTEGTDAQCWQLSLDRAQALANLLIHQCGVSPKLIEISGRGSWENEIDPEDATVAIAAQANRRADVVVIYSGPRAAQTK